MLDIAVTPTEFNLTFQDLGLNYGGAPGWILTTDLPLRRRTLYTAELREQWNLDFETRDKDCQENFPARDRTIAFMNRTR